jgi:hypothetical protein
LDGESFEARTDRKIRGVIEDKMIFEPLFRREVERLDSAIGQIKAPAFALANALRDTFTTQNPTALVIEDASGRFIGEFLWRVLREHGVLHDQTEVFVMRPPRNLGFLSAEMFGRRVGELAPRLGAAPLIVTEYVATADTAVEVTEMFKAAGIRPHYGVLFALEKLVQQRGESGADRLANLDAGSVSVGARVAKPADLKLVHGNSGLNGILSKGTYFEAFTPSPTSEDSKAEPAQRWAAAPGGDLDADSRELLRRHVRHQLQSLVEEYSCI